MRSELAQIMLSGNRPSTEEITLLSVLEKRFINEVKMARTEENVVDHLYCRERYSRRRSRFLQLGLAGFKMSKVESFGVQQKVESDQSQQIAPVVTLACFREEGMRLGLSCTFHKAMI